MYVCTYWKLNKTLYVRFCLRCNRFTFVGRILGYVAISTARRSSPRSDGQRLQRTASTSAPRHMAPSPRTYDIPIYANALHKLISLCRGVFILPFIMNKPTYAASIGKYSIIKYTILNIYHEH